MNNHNGNSKRTGESCRNKLTELLAAGVVLTNYCRLGMEKHPTQTEAKMTDLCYVKNDPQEQYFFQNKNIKDSFIYLL